MLASHETGRSRSSQVYLTLLMYIAVGHMSDEAYEAAHRRPRDEAHVVEIQIGSNQSYNNFQGSLPYAVSACLWLKLQGWTKASPEICAYMIIGVYTVIHAKESHSG